MRTPNKTTEAAEAAEPSLTRDVVNLGRYYFWSAIDRARPYVGGRRGMILLAVAVLAAGAALNWGWLVAIGLAPILVAVAPCAAMCALGLCAMKAGGKSCGTQSSATGGEAGGQSPSTAFVSSAAVPGAEASPEEAAAPRDRREEGSDEAADAGTGSSVLPDEHERGESAPNRSEPMNERS